MHAGERAAERRGVERERSVAVFLQRSGEELGQGMATTATILHADLDAFYASVEQLLAPSLCGKPIAVGGGVVLPLLTKPRHLGSAAACPDGKRASFVLNSILSAGISRTTNGWATPPSR